MPDPLLEAAERALDAGRPEEALELCRQLLASSPGHHGALFLEAEVLRELRDPEAAEFRYRRLLQDDTGNADAWSGLGTVLLDQCRFEDAQQCFTRAVRAAPGHPDALYGRAMLRERRRDHRGARRDYVRAWQASPRYPLPIPLSNDDIREIVLDACRRADPAVAAFVVGAPLLVVDIPEAVTCEAYDPPASPSELLGHFTAGVDPMDGSLSAQTSLPPALILFRKNLERYVAERDHLVRALRDSVLSQVAEWLDNAFVSE
jgi:tetratricopeptide (TPR) repeat protein